MGLSFHRLVNIKKKWKWEKSGTSKVARFGFKFFFFFYSVLLLFWHLEFEREDAYQWGKKCEWEARRLECKQWRKPAWHKWKVSSWRTDAQAQWLVSTFLSLHSYLLFPCLLTTIQSSSCRHAPLLFQLAPETVDLKVCYSLYISINLQVKLGLDGDCQTGSKNRSRLFGTEHFHSATSAQGKGRI